MSQSNWHNICRAGSEATNCGAGQLNLSYLFVCSLVCNAQECMQEVPHPVREGSYSFSVRAYSRSEHYPYNNRTWTGIYITRFYGTKWLWV